MGRLALVLEEILAACREKGVSTKILDLIVTLYRRAYREGYQDGKTDCEEAQEERDDVSELY